MAQRDDVHPFKRTQQAVHDYYIRNPEAYKDWEGDDFELMLKAVGCLSNYQDDFKGPFMDDSRDGSPTELTEDPYVMVKKSFPSQCPRGMSCAQYEALKRAVDELPQHQNEPWRPLFSDESGDNGTELMLDQMQAIRQGGRSGGAAGAVVGALGWVFGVEGGREVGKKVGMRSAKRDHIAEHVNSGHPLSPWSILRAAKIGGSSGFDSGATVASPGEAGISRAVGGVIGGTVGFTIATGGQICNGIASLFK